MRVTSNLDFKVTIFDSVKCLKDFTREQWQPDRMSFIIYQIAPFSMTLSPDFKGMLFVEYIRKVTR